MSGSALLVRRLRRTAAGEETRARQLTRLWRGTMEDLGSDLSDEENANQANRASGSSNDAEDRRRTSERLECIQSQAKRLCAAISSEMTHLGDVTDKAISAGEAADKKAAEAGALAELAHAEEANRLQEAAAALQAEKQSMANQQQYNEQIVLEVGGTKFKTSRSTLCKHEGSFLEAMFSGRHAHQPNADGSFFIDRDPTHFQRILNYLRTGAAVTPESASARHEMAEEAHFYGLPALHRALVAPPLDMEALLGDEIVRMRASEASLRARYCLRDASGASKDAPMAHEGLLSLFEGGDDSIAKQLKHTADPCTFPILLDDLRDKHQPLYRGTLAKPDGSQVVVESLRAFETNYNRQHPNMLHRLAPLLASGKLLLAGGSVLQALTAGCRLGHLWGPNTDIDIFLHSCNAEEATQLTKQIFEVVALDNESWSITRGRGVISMIQHTSVQWHGGRDESRRHQAMTETVQVILRRYESPAEVLLGFDIDCACAGYDGTSLWALPRCVRALRHSVNVLNPLHAWPVRCAYELRLAKYALRGYAIAVPGLDWGKVDHGRLATTKLADLSGLARLLRVSNALLYAEPSSNGFVQGQKPAALLSGHSDIQRALMNSMDEDEWLTFRGGSDFYDDLAPGGKVLVPRVIQQETVAWMGYAPDGFPEIGEVRVEAWQEILDAGEGHGMESVPRKLVDAWDNSRRSREYLNAAEHDCDAKYYAHAMCDKPVP